MRGMKRKWKKDLKEGECLRQVYYNMYDYGRLVGAYTASDLQVKPDKDYRTGDRKGPAGTDTGQ